MGRFFERHTILVMSVSIFFLFACSSSKKSGYPLKKSVAESSLWPGKNDIENIVIDMTGLVELSSRLCSSLSDDEQRDLGYLFSFRALEKARALTNGHPSGRIYLLAAKCSWLKADWEKEKEEILKISSTGIEVAEQAVALNRDPYSYYMLALNRGLWINNKGYDAIIHMGKFEDAIKNALPDPDIDMGGPMRVIGLFYVRAPSWPVGPGNLDKALDYLSQAAEKYPSHPQNHLFYAEALIKDENYEKASIELDETIRLSEEALWGDYADRWRSEAEVFRRKIDQITMKKHILVDQKDVY